MLIRWVAIAFILVTASCGGSSSKSRHANSSGDGEGSGNLKSLIDEDNEKEDKDVIARRQCLGENKKPKECMSDEDCCQGFYCGKDPEGSSRVKVCIEGS